mmetsp:Transcript_93725/g.265064  ORF Transcript_93725/g.265064 Transcript_93725/m.265064 type:complete len:261 (-) Transcript_93725:177-959(-)
MLLCAEKPVPPCCSLRMSSLLFSFFPVMGHFISGRTQSFSTLSRTTIPDGFRSTACWCVMGCLETAQQKTPRPPPASSIFSSSASSFMGSRSLTRSFFPDIGHLVAVSTFDSSRFGALGAFSLAQKLFSRSLLLSRTSNSPSLRRCSSLSSLRRGSLPVFCSARVCLFSSARSSAFLCLMSSESRPWSAFWKSSISFCLSCCLSCCSFRAFLRSCSSNSFCLPASSSFWFSRDSRMNSLSYMCPSGVVTGFLGGFSEREQ